MFIFYTMPPPPILLLHVCSKVTIFFFFFVWNPVNHKLQRARNELSAVTLFFFKTLSSKKGSQKKK